MKLLLFAVFLLGFTAFAKADQLAYLSKDDAERAAAYMRKTRKLYLFCGCCDDAKGLKIRAEKVEVKYTGKDEYYEVFVTYYPPRGTTPVTVPVDLAYTWTKRKFKTFTIAAALDMPHDACRPLPRRL